MYKDFRESVPGKKDSVYNGLVQENECGIFVQEEKAWGSHACELSLCSERR